MAEDPQIYERYNRVTAELEQVKWEDVQLGDIIKELDEYAPNGPRYNFEVVVQKVDEARDINDPTNVVKLKDDERGFDTYMFYTLEAALAFNWKMGKAGHDEIPVGTKPASTA